MGRPADLPIRCQSYLGCSLGRGPTIGDRLWLAHFSRKVYYEFGRLPGHTDSDPRYETNRALFDEMRRRMRNQRERCPAHTMRERARTKHIHPCTHAHARAYAPARPCGLVHACGHAHVHTCARACAGSRSSSRSSAASVSSSIDSTRLAYSASRWRPGPPCPNPAQILLASLCPYEPRGCRP